MGYVQQNKWKAGRIFPSLNLIIDKIHIPNRVNFVLKEALKRLTIRQNSLTCKNILVALQLLKPFFLQVAVTTAEEFEQLIHQAEIEMYGPTFSGICYGISAWGTTPL
jgi:hypothetical protein